MDQTKLDEFLAVIVADLASTSSAVLVRIGDRLGLYRAMADAGPMTAAELAERTGTAQRYVQEWLNNQAAGGYLHYEAASGRYQLPEEHALVLADEASPVLMLGGFDLVATYFADEDTFVDAFRTGSGVGWHEHDPRFYPACERFFRPLYRGSLLQSWIPALDGVHDRLINGIEVADIGCGYGTSTVEMARAYPKSRFTGFDYHDVSISAARKAAAEAGVADRVHFEVATAAQFPGDYDPATPGSGAPGAPPTAPGSAGGCGQSRRSRFRPGLHGGVFVGGVVVAGQVQRHPRVGGGDLFEEAQELLVAVPGAGRSG